MNASTDRDISSLVICSQIHELIDNCYAISLKLSPATQALIPMNSLRIARAMLPNMYPSDLFIEEAKEPELNIDSAVKFAKKNNMSVCHMLFDNLLDKLDAKFIAAIDDRNEEYFLNNMAGLLKGTLAESLTKPLQVIILNPELTKDYKQFIWDNLDSISGEVQDYKDRVK